MERATKAWQGTSLFKCLEPHTVPLMSAWPLMFGKIHDGVFIESSPWDRGEAVNETFSPTDTHSFSLCLSVHLVRLGSQRGFEYIMLSELWLLDSV